MGAHTPGPWEVVERSDTFNIKAGNRCIARLQKKAGAKDDAYFITTLETSHAELLGALKAVYEILAFYEGSEEILCGVDNPLVVINAEPLNGDFPSMLIAARKAITRAEEKS